MTRTRYKEHTIYTCQGSQGIYWEVWEEDARVDFGTTISPTCAMRVARCIIDHHTSLLPPSPTPEAGAGLMMARSFERSPKTSQLLRIGRR